LPSWVSSTRGSSATYTQCKFDYSAFDHEIQFSIQGCYTETSRQLRGWSKYSSSPGYCDRKLGKHSILHYGVGRK
jgi:hypothetical protein